jgi:hypothetical protein
MQRLGSVLAVLVFMLLASACDEPSDPKHLAVSATGSEGLTIHFVPCPGGHVQRVRLILRRGDDPYDGNDPILWEITVQEASARTEFPVGVTPSGFDQEVPLTEGIPNVDLVAFVEASSGARVGLGFRRPNLRDDEVLVEDEFKTLPNFEKDALADCA